MVTTTSKELLELERQNPSSPKSSILICDKKTCENKERDRLRKSSVVDGEENRPLISTASKSEVLGKVKNFLGIMAESNKQLELNVQENPHVNYDIEAVRGDEAEYIEMDLLLGVADLQTPEAVAAAEATVGGCQLPLPSSSITSSDSGSESSSSSSDEDEDAGNSENVSNNNTCHGKKSSSKQSKSKSQKRPKIVVLN